MLPLERLASTSKLPSSSRRRTLRPKSLKPPQSSRRPTALRETRRRPGRSKQARLWKIYPENPTQRQKRQQQQRKALLQMSANQQANKLARTSAFLHLLLLHGQS